jgi:hypothetical protein
MGLMGRKRAGEQESRRAGCFITITACMNAIGN